MKSILHPVLYSYIKGRKSNFLTHPYDGFMQIFPASQIIFELKFFNPIKTGGNLCGILKRC